MKKLLLALTLALVSFIGVNAQDGIRYGLIGGINLNSVSISVGGVSLSSKSFVGFDFGVKGEYGLPVNGLYLDGSVMFTQRAGDGNSVYYAELPINIGYKYAINDKIALFGKTGPMFGIGLFGSEDNTFDVIKRFNMAWGIHGGVEFANHYQLSVGYNAGISNILKESSVSNKLNNIVISFAYMF